MLYADIPDGHYGGATRAIRTILTSAREIKWLPRGEDSQANQRGIAAAEDHLRLARQAAGDQIPARAQPHLVEGEWAGVKALLRSTGASEPSFAPGNDWHLGIVQQENMSAVDRSQELKALVKPPVWPRKGLFNVVNSLLADEDQRDRLAQTDEDRESIWEVMCQADYDVNAALIWALATKGDASNPFVPLVSLYSTGFYPLGYDGDRFILFRLLGR